MKTGLGDLTCAGPSGASTAPLPAIAGFREWAEVNYPLAPGWNSATEILLRQAWMASATRHASTGADTGRHGSNLPESAPAPDNGSPKQDAPAPVCAPLSAAAGIVQPVDESWAERGIELAKRLRSLNGQNYVEALGELHAHLCIALATPPTPASEAVVQDAALKDHEIRELVNNLTGIAKAYYGTDQLRERISTVVLAALRSLPQQPTGERNGDS